MLIPLLVAITVVLVGCAGGESQDPSLEDSLLTRSSTSAEAEMTAIVGGVLELDAESGCIMLSGKPVVWPADTTVSTEPPELHLPDGSRVRDGYAIKGGGGEVSAARLDETTM